MADLTLPLIQAPEDPPRNETVLRDNHPLAGAVVVNLSPALAEEIDRPGAWEGVMIVRIYRGSPAARLNFRFGDILVAVNRTPVDRVARLTEVLSVPADTWAITVNRRGQVRTLEFGS